MFDCCDQVFDTPETTSANGLLGDESKPTFDLIEPGGVGRSVVDFEARSLRQPETYPGMFVGGVVVDNQMNVKTFRHSVIDPLEKLKKLLVTMTCLALRQDSAGGDIEGGKQGGGAVANVVMGYTLHVPQSHEQHRLGPVDGLNLRLLINGEHDRMVGRVQIEPYHIAYFFNKEGVA